MDQANRNGNGASSPDQDTSLPETSLTENLSGDSSDIYDITILGAGPTGLFGAFYAGMREMKTKIIDALPEVGGQITALYPEKYIYDAPGHPKIIGKDLVKLLLEQAAQWHPAVCLEERVLTLQHREDGIIQLGTSKGTHVTRTVVIAAGIGAFY